MKQMDLNALGLGGENQMEKTRMATLRSIEP
jgi:hypothetical protein